MKKIELPEENTIDSLITSYLSGNASPDEVSRLNSWASESDENKKYFRAFCDIWHLSAGINQVTSEDDYSFDKIVNKKPESIAEGEERVRRIKSLSIFKYAASILILITAGYFVGRLTSASNVATPDDNSLAVIYAPMGSKAVSILPDGTQVWLNAGSRIEYNTQNYNQSIRKVALVGEAYFKVKTNPEKPFVVNAKGINVKATGTEFNVKAYPEESQVVTTLVEGKVKIEGQDQSKRRFTLEMKPKQIVTLAAPVTSQDIIEKRESIQAREIVKPSEKKLVSENPVIVSDVNLDKYTSWKEREWVLEGEDIGNLVVMLERKFNVKISVESAELNKYKFTGTFRNETLEQVLSVLKIATPMKYTIGKGTVALRIDPDSKAKYQKLISTE